MTGPLNELLQFALTLATEAEKKILPHFNAGVRVDDKADGTPVTIADKGAEETMRGMIARQCPDHAILGEEFGTTVGKSEYRWILDPIDGTKAFICGVPLFGTLIALEHTPAGQPATMELGVVHFPALQRTAYATRGGGAFERDGQSLDVRPLHVSSTGTLDKSLVLTSSLHNLTDPTYTQAMQRIVRQARYARSWGDCFGYYQVARGAAEAMIDTVLSFWDIAALVPLITEAGGRVSGLNGAAPGPDTKHAFATNGQLHETLLAEFRNR